MVVDLPETVRNRLFGFLRSQDLKIIRLVCKALDFSAQRTLFRLVWLRANIDSFHKLDLISRHPTLRHHVTTIHHSGEMLYDYPNFDRWNQQLGGEINLSAESRDSLRQQFTPEDLQYHYFKYRIHIDGQTYIKANPNLAELLLVKALRQLPQIDTIEFASKEVEPEEEIPDRSLPFSLSAIGQETLSEPSIIGGRKYHSKQFSILLRAVSQSCPNLTTIKGVHLRWEILAKPDQLQTMVSVVNHIQHLILTILNYPKPDKKKSRQKLARVIGSAPDLMTLELYFGSLPITRFDEIIELNQLLKKRNHWPALQRLVLQGFRTTEHQFITFLQRHATSLRSLALSNMEFGLLVGSNARGRELRKGGSFCSLIKFLQLLLKLEHVEFSGTFYNHWDERWIVNYGDDSTDDEACLKSQIERFILCGGRCPLQAPDQNNENDGWHLRGDDSWHYDYRLITNDTGVLT